MNSELLQLSVVEFNAKNYWFALGYAYATKSNSKTSEYVVLPQICESIVSFIDKCSFLPPAQENCFAAAVQYIFHVVEE